MTVHDTLALADAVDVLTPPTWAADLVPVDPTTQAACIPPDLYECSRCDGRGELDAWTDPFGNIDTVPCSYCAGTGGFAEPEHTIQAHGTDTAITISCSCGWGLGFFINRTAAVKAGEAHLKAGHR